MAAASARRLAATLLNLPRHAHNVLGTSASSTMCGAAENVEVALPVRDVQLPNGTIRSVIKIAPTRRRPPVRCAVSEKTATALGKWIAESGIKGTDYIFPGQRGGRPRPMSSRQMARLLKSWVAEAGFDPKKYGIESLRRTKALHILNSTGDLETVRVLLGHEKIESTSHYLSIAKRTKSDFIAISLTFDI
jgi:site-specific recombinase XerD